MTRDGNDRRPGSGLGLVLLGLIPAAVFVGLELQGAFRGMRQYELEFLHRLPKGEASFYVKYLALLLPTGLLWGAGLAFLIGRRRYLTLLDRLAGMRDRTYLTVIAVTAAVLVLAFANWVLRNQPLTDDERVYEFQADLLSRGRLFAVPYPLPEFFDNVFIVNGTKWYGKYPPGHPLVLILGVTVGYARIVPALLAGLNAVLFYFLAREFFSVRLARAAGLLLLASPFFLFTGGTLLSHTTCLAALQIFGLGALRAAKSPSVTNAAIAGAGIGFAFLARPYTALMFGVPVGLLWGVSAARKRLSWKPLLIATATASVFLGLFLVHNFILTDSPFRTGYDEVKGQRSKVLGFGDVLSGHYAHTPLNGILNVGLTIVRLNFWTWGWPLSWLFVLAALLWTRDSRLKPLWAVLLATGIGSVFYFSMGVADAGPAKYYELLPVLAILSISGLFSFDQRISKAGRPGLSSLAPSLVVALCAVGWGFFARIQIAELRNLTDRIALPYRLVANLEDHKLLVFTADLQRAPFDSWVFSSPNNLPDHEKRVLYVRDRGLKNRQLMDRMPDRTPYLLKLGDDRRYSLTRLTGDETTKRWAEDKVQEGIGFLRQMKSREAIDAFIKATEIDPGYGRAYLLLGWACEQAGLSPEAERAYRKALELDSSQAEWNYFFGRFLGRQQKWKEAEEYLLKSQAKDPRSKETQRVLDLVRSRTPPP